MMAGKDYLKKAGIATLLLMFLQISIVSAQGNKGWHANTLMVEKLSKDSPDFNYYEERVPKYTLPDIFTSNDGVKITTADLWNKLRRPEIIELFRKYVYGTVPETQYQKKFKIVSVDM